MKFLVETSKALNFDALSHSSHLVLRFCSTKKCSFSKAPKSSKFVDEKRAKGKICKKLHIFCRFFCGSRIF